MPTIKRYSNRKLYDTESKRYIKLEDVAELIRRGQDVRVTDHDTGADITALVQAQTILELEKRLKGGLPGVVLTTLIRAGNDTLHQLRGGLASEDLDARVNAKIEERVQILVGRGQLAPEEATRVLDLLLSAGGPDAATAVSITDQDIEGLLRQKGLASRQDWTGLMERLDRLDADLDALNRSRGRRARRKKMAGSRSRRS